MRWSREDFAVNIHLSHCMHKRASLGVKFKSVNDSPYILIATTPQSSTPCHGKSSATSSKQDSLCLDNPHRCTNKQWITGSDAAAEKNQKARVPAPFWLALMPGARATVVLKRKEEHYKCLCGSISLTRGKRQRSSRRPFHTHAWENIFSTRAEDEWANPAPLESLMISAAEERDAQPASTSAFPFLLGTECREGKSSTAARCGEVCGGSVKVSVNRE